MIYGDGRVRPRMMAFSCWMVALGTLLSTTWILSANSWMQDPTGYVEVNGQFQASDWWKVIFNPAVPYEVPHMILAAYLVTGFIVASVYAVIWLRGNRSRYTRVALAIPLAAA